MILLNLFPCVKQTSIIKATASVDNKQASGWSRGSSTGGASLPPTHRLPHGNMLGGAQAPPKPPWLQLRCGLFIHESLIWCHMKDCGSQNGQALVPKSLEVVPKSIDEASWGRLPIQGRSLIVSGIENVPNLIQESIEIGPKIDPEGSWKATSRLDWFFLRFWLRFWSIVDAKIESR